ncbi:hypothetical protein [Dactylosporangium sp. CA-139066]|uniref:hypothetical protein n=1 Tax=Dactylosporangium sp. CA-139066 TaxID=3239930 RepID=UPI003D919FE2
MALPELGTDLHAPPACCSPAAGLGDRLGSRRVFVAGLVLFGAASVMCALSPAMPPLPFARAAQGAAAALRLPRTETLRRARTPMPPCTAMPPHAVTLRHMPTRPLAVTPQRNPTPPRAVSP